LAVQITPICMIACLSELDRTPIQNDYLLAEPGEHWSQGVIQASAQTIAADCG
jgi:hypothetical protein